MSQVVTKWAQIEALTLGVVPSTQAPVVMDPRPGPPVGRRERGMGMGVGQGSKRNTTPLDPNPGPGHPLKAGGEEVAVSCQPKGKAMTKARAATINIGGRSAAALAVHAEASTDPHEDEGMPAAAASKRRRKGAVGVAEQGLPFPGAHGVPPPGVMPPPPEPPSPVRAKATAGTTAGAGVGAGPGSSAAAATATGAAEGASGSGMDPSVDPTTSEAGPSAEARRIPGRLMPWDCPLCTYKNAGTRNK